MPPPMLAMVGLLEPRTILVWIRLLSLAVKLAVVLVAIRVRRALPGRFPEGKRR